MKTFTLRFMLLSLISAGISFYSYAQDAVSLRTDRPSEYTVVKGDTRIFQHASLKTHGVGKKYGRATHKLLILI